MFSHLLPPTDDCKEKEWEQCYARCGGKCRTAGCYVTIKWKLRGIRANGKPLRSEERRVECNCVDPDEESIKVNATPLWETLLIFLVPWPGNPVYGGL
jgi:hypothetical protein